MKINIGINMYTLN